MSEVTTPVISYPAEVEANSIVLRPVVHRNPDGSINVVDQDSGKPIRFAGMEAALWEFGAFTDRPGNILRCSLENVPLAKEQV